MHEVSGFDCMFRGCKGNLVSCKCLECSQYLNARWEIYSCSFCHLYICVTELGHMQMQACWWSHNYLNGRKSTADPSFSEVRSLHVAVGSLTHRVTFEFIVSKVCGPINCKHFELHTQFWLWDRLGRCMMSWIVYVGNQDFKAGFRFKNYKWW